MAVCQCEWRGIRLKLYCANGRGDDGRTKRVSNFPLFELIAEAYKKLQASKIGEKKALPVYLIKYLYNFQGDSWCNFRVFYRFPVLASTHFWRCVHWKHRPVLRMMGSCFRKHKKPGLETRRHSGCGTCKLCLCRGQGLELLKNRKKKLKSKLNDWFEKRRYLFKTMSLSLKFSGYGTKKSVFWAANSSVIDTPITMIDVINLSAIGIWFFASWNKTTSIITSND